MNIFQTHPLPWSAVDDYDQWRINDDCTHLVATAQAKEVAQWIVDQANKGIEQKEEP